MSHAELDDATDSTPATRPTWRRLPRAARRLPAPQVVGGCCGTDHRHIDAIAGPASRRPILSPPDGGPDLNP